MAFATPDDLVKALKDISRWIAAVEHMVAKLPPDTRIEFDPPENGGVAIDFRDCRPATPPGPPGRLSQNR